MYKITYSSGLGETKINEVFQKDHKDWVKVDMDKEIALVEEIKAKHFDLTHFHESANQVGYGTFFVTNRLTFVTGEFQFPDKM